jgi:hypothetical protein
LQIIEEQRERMLRSSETRGKTSGKSIESG